ncbi:MAG: hypothetical protein ABIK66_05960 [candidate division WOR-3 bacterium]
MRKLIIFLLLISFTLFGRKYYVPEEFSTINGVAIFAENYDTISIFSPLRAKENKTFAKKIKGKEVIFEIRGEENENILAEIEKLSSDSADNRNRQYPLPGWQGAKMINDSLHRQVNAYASIKLDRNSIPWVVWFGYEGIGLVSKEIAYTKWMGNGFDRIKFIEEKPESAVRCRPYFTFDESNIPFVVYNYKWGGYHLIYDDIFFTRQINNLWTPGIMINKWDSLEKHFMPRIDCNGGKMWCVWFGGDPNSFYDIYVSKWNGIRWENEEKISPYVGGPPYFHWWADIAVDRKGNPHVVWAETEVTGRIYYRTHNGVQWEEPVILNDPNTIVTNPWTWVRIVTDTEDNLHVVWSGYDRRIGVGTICYNFYNHRTGEWSPPIKIKISDDCPPFGGCVAAISSSNVIVLWTKIISSRPWMTEVYISYFNGDTWSNEIRIDPAFIFPPRYGHEAVMFDNLGNPWIVFSSYEEYPTVVYEDLFYDRYNPLSINNFKKEKTIMIKKFNKGDIYGIRGERYEDLTFLHPGVYFKFDDKKQKITKLIILKK